MTPSSSKWPKKPFQIDHLECGTSWDFYGLTWPPKVVVCTGCGAPLKLVGHDAKTNTIAFRRI